MKNSAIAAELKYRSAFSRAMKVAASPSGLPREAVLCPVRLSCKVAPSGRVSFAASPIRAHRKGCHTRPSEQGPLRSPLRSGLATGFPARAALRRGGGGGSAASGPLRGHPVKRAGSFPVCGSPGSVVAVARTAAR